MNRKAPIRAARFDPGGAWAEVSTELSKDWQVWALFVRRPDGYVIAELRVLPAVGDWWNPPLGTWARQADPVPDTGLTIRLLRKVRIADLNGDLNDWIRQGHDHYAGASWGPPIFRGRGARARRPGKKGHQPDYYALWARDYVDCLADPRPIQALAKRQKVSSQRARDTVHDCRTKGYLTPGQRGKASGQLTKQAIVVLQKLEKGDVEDERQTRTR